MAERKIQVFLYGASISLEILSTAGIPKRAFAPASITGFDLVIKPVANLVENGDGIVYGILANFTHTEIQALFDSYLRTRTTATYQYEPVMAHTRGGRTVAAITFMSVDMEPAPVDKDYVNFLLKASKDYGFPGWYIQYIEAFIK
ncbi:hypothetical protein [Kordiimonas pumila]|uniref:Gamma-glutamylcyclotransferase n=1 Tax=Kordiimonas pumila TaxID=2161677 RepID=A0ABV7D6E2_9PROT|nr:hypothetical protein [Kordiimonas pumila]